METRPAMVLIYHRSMFDPRVVRLSPSGFLFWMRAIGECNVRRRDTLAVDELREAAESARAAGRDYEVDACLEELVEADLARRLPHDHVQLLARLDLWAFDDEGDTYVGVRLERDDD